MNHRPPHRSAQRLALAAAALCALAAGCSSSGGGARTPPPRAAGSSTAASTPAVSTAPAATSGAATTAPAGQLGGDWAGTYSGAYSGTFKLTWQQAGTALTGTIEISGFGNAPENITGNVQGSQINFGTVGANAVAYSGTVSGTSMSGTWQLKAAGGTGGSWTATKGS